MNATSSSSSATVTASVTPATDNLIPFPTTARAPSEAQYDRQLVQRFLGGEESAFVEIMERHRPMVFNKVLSMLRNHADAEEICQDTFVRAYRGLAKFRGDSSLATWLYRVSSNLARNRYWHLFRRRKQAHVSLDCEISEDGGATFSDLIESTSASPAEESATSEFNRIVQECTALLPAAHRQALELCTEKHLSYEEISIQMGVTVGTVKSRIARARQHLRSLVNAHCPSFENAQGTGDYFVARPQTASIRLAA
jgi:RNA polymerase sigma-70 factor (ECF subfamily)